MLYSKKFPPEAGKDDGLRVEATRPQYLLSILRGSVMKYEDLYCHVRAPSPEYSIAIHLPRETKSEAPGIPA